MKLIYYSTAYFASHGGSIHSKYFVEEARRNPVVNSVVIFPASRNPSSQKKGSVLRDWLRMIPLLQVVFFTRRNSFYLNALFHFIEKEKPDVILLRLDSNFNQIERIREKFPSLIIACEVNASPFDESFKNIAFRSFFKRKERKALEGSDVNFFVSKNLRARIMGSSILETRDIVVQNGVDVKLFKPSLNQIALRTKLSIHPEQTVLGYVGTLDTHKNVDVLIRAFGKIAHNYPLAQLLIVGDGPEKNRLMELSGQEGLSKKITFAGKCSHDEVPDYLNSMDMAIHHSANDYMSPIKLFEYLACKLPVIGPDTSAVKEVFVDGVHLVVTNGTSEDLFAKMTKIIEDVSFRNELATNGFNLVTKQYTWRHNVDLIVSKLLIKHQS
jgi:glycosyltransferase involved in cell wall biosynthesis